MRMRPEPLPETELTSMVDIIFQLMIFFLVTMSVMPSVKSAPQVEGMMNLPTPKQGDSEASVLIQFYRNPSGNIDYYVLQGNDQSAEFYQWFKDKRAVLSAPSAYPAFRNIAANKYQLVYDDNSIKAFLMGVRDNDPAIILRAPGNLPYGDVVKVTGYMHSLGISKIAWVKGTLANMKVEIKKGRARRRGV